MTHPLDHQSPFSNIPDELTPEEAKRRFRARAEEILRQLDDPEWYTRQMLQMRPRTIVPPDPERESNV